MLHFLLIAAIQCPDGSPPPCSARAAARTAPALSVAVLNFENRSRDSNDAWLAEGLADEISARLGQVGRLSVTSRAVVRRMRGVESMPIPQIGRGLNTTYLVTGAVQGSGRQLRISVELLRASTGVQAWTSTYDRGRDDLLAIQADIATAVAGAIAGRLLPQERATLARRPTDNPAAYELFLRGMVHYRRSNSGADALAAVGLFDQAVQLDPSFARAWSGLSQGHGFTWWTYADRTEARRQRWRHATERAIALAPGDLDTRIAQGYLAYWGSRDYSGARLHFEAALRLDSMRAEVWSALANVERRQGLWEASIANRIRALALNPQDLS